MGGGVGGWSSHVHMSIDELDNCKYKGMEMEEPCTHKDMYMSRDVYEETCSHVADSPDNFAAAILSYVRTFWHGLDQRQAVGALERGQVRWHGACCR
jgi:hypothetical protein